MSWQLLVPTIPHRHEKLCALLAVLDAQMRPGVRVLLYRDNLEASYRAKMQALMDAADADHVSYLSDDDSVSPEFLPMVAYTLTAHRPQYVGFRVRYTESGVTQLPVIHSLRCGGWYATASGYYRDLMYYNPVQRELVADIPFRGRYCDEEWAADVRGSGRVKNESFIDRELLYYQRDAADNFHTPREPLPAGQIIPLPGYPWLDVMKCAP